MMAVAAAVLLFSLAIAVGRVSGGSSLTMSIAPFGVDAAGCGVSGFAHRPCASLHFAANFINSSFTTIQFADGYYISTSTDFDLRYEPYLSAALGTPPFGPAPSAPLRVIGVNGSAAVTLDCGTTNTTADTTPQLKSAFFFANPIAGTSAAALLQGLTITNCAAQLSLGGAVMIYNYNVTLRDVVLTNNIGVIGHGALLAQSAVVTAIDCVIEGNYYFPAPQSEFVGAVEIADSTVSFTRVSFLNNTASAASAALLSNVNGTIVDSLFQANYADASLSTSSVAFGALAVAGTSVVTITGTIFGDGNYVQPGTQGFGGGAALVVFDQASLLVQSSIFTANHAYAPSNTVAQGGAVLLMSSGTVTFVNTTFDSNTCYSDDTAGCSGGAVYQGAPSSPPSSPLLITYTDCTFSNNLATYDGGAVVAAAGTTSAFQGGSLLNNTAGQNGGAYAGPGLTVVGGTTFEYNVAESQNGGALFISPNPPINSAISGYFYYNSALNGDGGSIMFNSGATTATVFINNAVIASSTAQNGGGLAFEPGTSNTNALLGIVNSSFTNNIATNVGGGVFINAPLDGAPTCFISSVNFTGNTAAQVGGGLALSYGFCEGQEVVFTGNTASQGGAILLEQDAILACAMCHAEANVAQAGGVLASEGGVAVFSQSTFVRNQGTANGGFAIINGLPSSWNPAFSLYGAALVTGQCSIEANTAGSDCGAIVLQSTTWLSQYDRVDGNVAIAGTAGGGAVCVTQSSTLEIINSTFSNNLAPLGGGGAVGCNSGSVYAVNSTFTGNMAAMTSALLSVSPTSGGGGAIGAIGCGLFVDSGCVFSNNSAYEGGAIYHSAAPDLLQRNSYTNTMALYMKNAVVVDNTAVVGGGVYEGGVQSGTCASEPRLCAPFLSTEFTFVHVPGNTSQMSTTQLSEIWNTTFCNNSAMWAGSNIFHAQIRPAGIESLLFCGVDATTTPPATSAASSVSANTGAPYGSAFFGGPIFPSNANVPADVVAALAGGVGVSSNPYSLHVETQSSSAIASGAYFDSTTTPLIYMQDVYGQLMDFQSGSSCTFTVQQPPTGSTVASATLKGPLSITFSNAFLDLESIAVIGTPTANYSVMVHSVAPVGDVSLGLVDAVPDVAFVVSLAPCALGAETLANNIGCADCPRGFYNTAPGAACMPCLTGMVCNGGNDIAAANGYWFDAADRLYYACPVGYCPNGTCASHQHGPLCARCDGGFTRWAGACQDCTGGRITAGATAFWVFAAAVAFSFVHYLVSIDNKGSALLTVGTFFVQTVPLLASGYNYVKTDYPSNSTSSYTNSSSSGGGTSSTLDLPTLNSGDRYVAPFLGPFSFRVDLFSSTCLQGVTYYDKYIVVILSPFILIALTGLHYAVFFSASKLDRRPRDVAPHWSNFAYLRCIISIFKFMYAPIAKQAFEIFACDDSVPGYSFLRADYNQQCSGAQYNAFVVISIIIIVVFVVPFPFLILFAIHRARQSNEHRKDKFGFLFFHLSDDFWWYEAVLLFRRSIFAVLYVAFSYSINARSLVSVYFLLCLLILHLHTLPLMRKEENSVESLALAFMVFIATAYSSAWLADSYDLAPLVLALTLPPLLLLVFRLGMLQYTRVTKFIDKRRTTDVSMAQMGPPDL